MEETKTVIKKETKNKIRVEFERTSKWKRFKLKYLTFNFLATTVVRLFRFVLMVGVSYVILYPFFAKIAASVMTQDDFVNVTVRLISRSPTMDQFKYIILENRYFEALLNTTLLSLFCAVSQMLICCLVGYGLAKFKFRMSNLIFFAAIFTLIVPNGILRFAMFKHFSSFDLLWIRALLSGEIVPGLDVLSSWNGNIIGTDWPMVILSLTGLGFRNGLYIFMLRQFYKGVPDELEESAYIDGSGVFRTFFTIIIPLSVPMLITVFLFAFSWQWTDNYYTSVFRLSKSDGRILLPDVVAVPKSLRNDYVGSQLYNSAIYNTCALLIILPLLVVYLFCQRYLVQGIERSGIIG